MSLQDPFQLVDGFNNTKGVIIKWQVTEDAKQYILNKPFDYLILDATEKGGLGDLNFLIDAKEKIKCIRINNDQIDWSIINQLENLQVMHIGGWFNCVGLEFNKLKKLAYLKSYWNEGYSNSLRDIKSLQALTLLGLKETDLSFLGESPNLKYLALYNSRKLASIGVEGKNFKSLKHLEISGCSNFNDISGLSTSETLEFLHLDAKRFSDSDGLSKIKNLSHLILAAEFKDLKWLVNLKKLMLLRMSCKLSDGNLDFLFNMPNLQHVAFNNKRNYTVKEKDIQQYLTDKGYDQEEVLDSQNLNFPTPDKFLSE